MKTKTLANILAATTAFGFATASLCTQASSHREAPFIASMPKVDGTDFYMFNSYEKGRDGYVTIIANYQPLQEPAGGPNFFTMDPMAIYDINIDNNGDASPDIRFEFRFWNKLKDVKLDIAGQQIGVPLVNVGQVGPFAGDTANLNVQESYEVTMYRLTDNHGKRMKKSTKLVNMRTGDATFMKPVDNIGNKSIPDYQTYAQDHVYDAEIPDCGIGRVFVGQRKEGFVVNLGEAFDLVNTNPLGPVDGEPNTIGNKNITSLALEIPAECLVAANEPVIGAWTTARKNKHVRLAAKGHPEFGSIGKGTGPHVQVSRLGNPLVNELVIGINEKDHFNASHPVDDGHFAPFVTNPTLPSLLEILFGVKAPNLYPRTDLVAVFLTGVEGLNKPAHVRPAEMLRLNTGIAPVTASEQNNLGVLGGDVAGFPNGRRPGDDVVDIALRAVMGVLLPAEVAPDGQLPYTDGAYVDANMFDSAFPYLTSPIPGSPN